MTLPASENPKRPRKWAIYRVPGTLCLALLAVAIVILWPGIVSGEFRAPPGVWLLIALFMFASPVLLAQTAFFSFSKPPGFPTARRRIFFWGVLPLSAGAFALLVTRHRLGWPDMSDSAAGLLAMLIFFLWFEGGLVLHREATENSSDAAAYRSILQAWPAVIFLVLGVPLALLAALAAGPVGAFPGVALGLFLFFVVDARHLARERVRDSRAAQAAE